jgi:hypothetical protein
MDLVRKIVLALEDHEPGFAPDNFAIQGYNNDVVAYHVYVMAQGGLLEAQEVNGFGDTSPGALPRSLTWAGHEFAAATRNEGVWNQAKTLVTKAGSSAFPVWIEVLMKLAIKAIKP